MPGGYINALAVTIGASEPALRLLLSVLLGYPLAFLYRQFIYRKSTFINHLYIAICGLSIIIFNYGFDTYHSIIAITVSYLFINVLQGTPLICASFIFHMGYLLIGYYYTGTETYDIKWTMPHCVLTLRLIGLSFDVSDGQKPDEKLSTENKKSCLRRKPSILEIFAYTLFPASLLVGPQFSFRRYDSFIGKEFDKYKGHTRAGLIRGALGLGYLIMYQLGSAWLPDDYLLSTEYANRSIWHRWIMMGIWGKFVMYKYICCWLLSEGAAMCFGLTFNGVDKSGNEDWTGCTNIRLATFENAEKFHRYIEAFNANTNHWLAEYVFKRLKFLGNRYISHLSALMFLAVWHGFHSGYYICFLFEFIVIVSEREILNVLNRNEPLMKFCENPFVECILWVILKFYTVVGMGWCLLPFAFLSFGKWWYLYKTVWFYGFIVWIPFPIYTKILKIIFPPTKKSQEQKQHNN